MKEAIESNIVLCREYLARRLNSAREKYSPDQLILFTKMCCTLRALAGEEAEEYIDELYNSMFKHEKRVIGNKEWNNIIEYDSKMDILKRLHGKKKVTVSEIFRLGSSTTDIYDYIWLRKHGFLRKSRDGRLVVDRRIYSENFERDIQRTISVNDVRKYLAEIPSRLWPKILNTGFLRRIDNETFTLLANEFYGYNAKVNRRMIRELDRRLSNGWEPEWHEWKTLGEIADKIGSLRGRKYLGPYSIQYMDFNEIERKETDKIISDLTALPLNERWKIISKIYRKKGSEEILSRFDLFTLSCIGNPGKVMGLSNVVLLGKALTSYLTYILSGDASFLDYSGYFLFKIDPNKLDPRYRPLYRSLLDNDLKGVMTYLSKHMPAEAIEYLGQRVWEYIRNKGSLDRELLLKAVRLSYEILKYNISGWRETGKRRESIHRGKLNVRKTIYNFIHMDYTLSRTAREKKPSIIGVIDVSGSMIRYSTWAVLSLASIMPLLKIYILFSDKMSIYRPPSRISSGIIVRFLEKTFEEGFRGYTDIGSALRKSSEFASSRDIIVLFSDLEQTTGNIDPVDEAARIISENKTLLVFTPPLHRVDVAEELRRIGVEVVTMNSPEKLARFLGRRLNLKIRSKLIHVRG